MNDNSRAAGAAAVTVVLWASAFVAIRSAGGHFSPGALALGRLLVASLALGVLWLFSGDGWPPRAAWPGILGSGWLTLGGGALCLAGVAVSRGRKRSPAPVEVPDSVGSAAG